MQRVDTPLIFAAKSAMLKPYGIISAFLLLSSSAFLINLSLTAALGIMLAATAGSAFAVAGCVFGRKTYGFGRGLLHLSAGFLAAGIIFAAVGLLSFLYGVTPLARYGSVIVSFFAIDRFYVGIAALFIGIYMISFSVGSLGSVKMIRQNKPMLLCPLTGTLLLFSLAAVLIFIAAAVLFYDKIPFSAKYIPGVPHDQSGRLMLFASLFMAALGSVFGAVHILSPYKAAVSSAK